MKITPPADDYGLQKLRQADSNKSVKETSELSAYPRIPADNEPREPQQHPLSERRKQRRRKRERRLVKKETLLDTRSSHERRTHSRRQQNRPDSDNEADNTPSTGIDNFI